MEIYVVGGAVRDTLLNRPVNDIDYVVVGSTPEEMITNGFHQVGADFPVFLHPLTGEEYALARTERKTAVGYNGFETNFESTITLEDDLLRRDLTINSMAVRLTDWEDFVSTPQQQTRMLIDPFHGIYDLLSGTLRHTSEAFAEDPVRVLRTARFAARYGFDVDLETHRLMTKVVHELAHVPQERIWAEFAKGLMEDRPEKMIRVLQAVGAFQVEAMRPYSQAKVHVLEKMNNHKNLEMRFVAVSHGFNEDDYETCRIPAHCARLSRMVKRFGPHFHAFHALEPSHRLDILMQLRAPTDEQFVLDVSTTVALMYEQTDSARTVLINDLKAIKSIDAGVIAAQCKTGTEIKNKIFEARVQKMMEENE